MVLWGLVSFAQTPISFPVRQPEAPDSADLAYYGRPKFGQAALTLTGLNLGVWAFDRYVQNADFARISWKSFKENLRVGFKWDNDRLSTNMFLHPYHGNLYYNSGRANGFNYWQSGLFAITGSAMWELVLENEYPSTNDIIATPIGGMALGEVMFRASDIVLKDNTRGSERFGRELAAFLISPMRGITRIINGDAWRYRPTTGRLFGIPNVAVELSVGTRWMQMQKCSAARSWGGTMSLDIEYGDRYEMRSSKPYDYFTFHIDMAVQRHQPVFSQINIMGRLISRELIDTKHHDLNIGMYQHYDFYDSDTISTEYPKVPYRLGIPASAGVGLQYRGTDIGQWSVDAYSHVNAVMLGGILSDHYNLEDRNYNLASGFSVMNGVNAIYKNDLLSFAATYNYYRMFTWGYPRGTDVKSANPRTLNAQGDASTAFFAVATARVDVRLIPKLYLTGEFSHYNRSTRYRDFPAVHSSSFSTRLMLSYKF